MSQTVCMIHHIGLPAYLGCVAIDDEIAQDDPMTLFDVWWEEYNQETNGKTQFIDWLIDKHYAGAEEVRYDHDSPNMPVQIYVGNPNGETDWTPQLGTC